MERAFEGGVRGRTAGLDIGGREGGDLPRRRASASRRARGRVQRVGTADGSGTRTENARGGACSSTAVRRRRREVLVAVRRVELLRDGGAANVGLGMRVDALRQLASSVEKAVESVLEQCHAQDTQAETKGNGTNRKMVDAQPLAAVLDQGHSVRHSRLIGRGNDKGSRAKLGKSGWLLRRWGRLLGRIARLLQLPVRQAAVHKERWVMRALLDCRVLREALGVRQLLELEPNTRRGTRDRSEHQKNTLDWRARVALSGKWDEIC